MTQTEDFESIRLDQYIGKKYPDLSRSVLTKLVSGGKATVNGKTVTKPGYRVKENDKIAIDYQVQAVTVTGKIDLDIVYEDKDCVVLSKPAGILTHSKGAFNPEPTVASWLGERISGMSGERAGIVHRLDRATSGVMICAKNETSQKWLQKQFSQRRVKKEYVAIVQGLFDQPEAIIDMPIIRNPKKPQTFRVGSNGKAAVTEYHVLADGYNKTMVQLKPTTGRTHQLRVHMECIGHPIVGDTLYGGMPGKRMFLHAKSLELTLPNKQRKTFEVSVPPDFKRQLTP